MERSAFIERKTKETEVRVRLDLDGSGRADVSTGVPFFDHMLELFAAHGFFDLSIAAKGDLEVDAHHTVEDVGLVLGDAFSQALGERKGIRRYGHAVTPMDEALAEVAVDLSNRPFLVYQVQADVPDGESGFGSALTKEFFRALCVRGGMTLHVLFRHGENGHHVLESIFKACGRSLQQAVRLDPRIGDVRSTKGRL